VRWFEVGWKFSAVSEAGRGGRTLDLKFRASVLQGQDFINDIGRSKSVIGVCTSFQPFFSKFKPEGTQDRVPVCRDNKLHTQRERLPRGGYCPEEYEFSRFSIKNLPRAREREREREKHL
jgi:hypothetical protein